MADVSRKPKKRSALRRAAPRRYRSELRDDQVQQTRERILDGFVAALNESPSDASIPRIAKHAHVSVPTVYRHFATRGDLEKALNVRLQQQIQGGGFPELPPTPAGLADGVRELYVRLSRLDPTIRYLGRLGLGQDERLARASRRAEWIDASLAGPMSRLPDHERVLLRDVLRVLCSSAGLQAFEDYLGLSADQAADRVEWLVHTLADAAGRRKPGGTRR